MIVNRDQANLPADDAFVDSTVPGPAIEFETLLLEQADDVFEFPGPHLDLGSFRLIVCCAARRFIVVEWLRDSIDFRAL